MAKRALILVDIQNDLVSVGALAVPERQAVVPVANRWIARFAASGNFVVATQDWLPRDHVSFVTQNPGRRVGESVEVDGMPQVIWPEHCVKIRMGRRSRRDWRPAGFTPWCGKARISGSRYSGLFDNHHKHHRKETELAGRLREAGVSGVYILGLATDYCVKFTALDARRLGFET